MDKGIVKYWTATIPVELSLPAKKPVCAFCKLLRTTYGQAYCADTGEPIDKPDRYRGDECRAEWEEAE